MTAPSKPIASLVAQIESRCPELVWERTKPNRLGSAGTTLLAQHLADSSGDYHSILRSLTLCNTGLTSEGLMTLIGALYPRPLTRSGFSTSSTTAYTNLTSICLKSNAIGSKGVKSLAQVLLQDCKLSSLDLYDNSLGNAAIRPLLEALRTNSSLETLNLWYNRLSTEISTLMASVMKYNTGLKSLLLGGNDFGDDACSEFRVALQTNTQMIEVDLTGNTMSHGIRESIKNILRHNAKSRRILHDLESHGTASFCVVTPPSDVSSGSQRNTPADMAEDLSAITQETARNSSVILMKSSFKEDPSFSVFFETHNEYLTRISMNRLGETEFPSALLELKRVSSLDLRGNQIRVVPNEIGQLSSLRVLHLSHNQIESLPATLVMLTQLETWSLHANPLSLIPRSYLENSLFPEHPQRSSLWKYLNSIQLGGSQEVRLQKAKIMIVGDANVGKTSLLQCLPNDFASLFTRWSHRLPKPLATDGIDIETMKIRITPSTSPTRPSTMAIAVSHSFGATPSTSEAPSLVGSPNSSTVYAPSSSSVGSRPVSPTLSPSNSSSNLFTSSPISSPIPSIPVSPPSTPSQNLTSTSPSNINYEIWDFAGQEVYYTTHSFFLTQNTIYLVVFDLSREDDAAQTARIDYWIQSIQTRAGTSLSYIILVGTHADEAKSGSAELIQNLSRRWVASRDVLDILTVSCKTGQGIESLKSTLNSIATKFGLACQLYPKSWLQIGDVLKALMNTQPWISYDKLLDIASKFYVTPATLELGVLPALKDLGTVLHFSDAQLQDTVFLNPQFIIKAFADVLTVKHRGFIKSDGILHVKDLQHLWQGERRQFSDASLLQLFQLFDVAIRLDHDRLLVPALLSDSAPPYVHNHWSFGLDDESDLLAVSQDHSLFRRNYIFRFLPLGFFSKIIAQCYRSMNWEVICHWKGGIVCRSPDFERALATFDEQSFVLRLRVEGNRYSTMLTHFIQLIDTLIKGWYANAQFEVLIPVPDEHNREFCYIQRDEIMDSIRLASDSRAFVRASRTTASTEFLGTLFRVDLIAPDLALAGLKQVSIEELESELVREQMVGRGGQGRVFSGKFKNIPVAIKDFEVVLMASPEDFDTQQEWLNHERASKLRAQLQLQHETLILQNVRHPSIVRLLGFNIHKLIVLLEFISLGHLESYLAKGSGSLSFKKDPYQLNSPTLQIRIALDIASAMCYLHQIKPAILHRDLSANNIMLESLDEDAPVVAKLVDFGTASFIGKTGLGSYNNEKRYCLSPEVLQGRDHSYKSDVYSFAIILWQLWTGYFTHGLNPKEILRGSRPSTDIIPTPWQSVSKDISNDLTELIQSSWDQNPEKRPDFAHILERLVSIGLALGLKEKTLERFKMPLVSDEADELPDGHSWIAWQDHLVLSISSQPYSSLDSTSSGIEVTSLARGDANTLAIGGSDGLLRLWSGNGSIQSLVVFPCDVLGLLHLDKNMYLCMTGTSLAVIDGDQILSRAEFLAAAVSARLSPSSFLLGSSIGSLTVWNVNPLERVKSVQLDQCTAIVGLYQLNPSSWIVVTEIGATVLQLDDLTFSPVLHMPTSRSPISAACLLNQSLWIGCANGSIFVGDLVPDPSSASLIFKSTAVLKAHTKRVTCMASAASAIASAGEDGIFWWDALTLQTLEKPLRGLHRAPVTHMVLVDKDHFFSGARREGNVVMWNRPCRETSPMRAPSEEFRLKHW